MRRIKSIFFWESLFKPPALVLCGVFLDMTICDDTMIDESMTLE